MPPRNNPAKRLSLRKADHDPRAAALVALAAVLEDGEDSQAAVDTAVRSGAMVPADKRLCTELVYGTLRQYLRLEWFTGRFLKKPDKLPREMLLCLRMALYELAFLRVPPHATLGWAVTHLRHRFGQGLAGVANGALRSMQRALPEFLRPSLYAKSFSTPEERLACLYAMPLWITRLWISAYGREQALFLLGASHEPAPTGIRLNHLRPDWRELRESLLLENDTGDDAETSPARRMKTGTDATALVATLLLAQQDKSFPDSGPASEAPAEGGSVEATGEKLPAALPPLPDHPRIHGVLAVGTCGLAFGGPLPWQARALVQQGAAVRQSAASYAALEALEPQHWPGPLWDCCAGSGGKTLALLEMGVSVALASDTSATRLERLRAELERREKEFSGGTGLPCLFVGSASTADMLPLPEQDPQGRNFGTILLDAPCSGLGTLAHRPEIRLRRTEEDVAALVVLQRDLLAAAARRVRPGGCIAYLTCTRNPAENEDQAAAFLASHPNATLLREYATPADSPLREFFYAALLRLP